MPPKGTKKRGTSTSRNTANGLSDRDARITAAGILQAVINSGVDPSEWGQRALYGLQVHTNLTRRLMATEKKPLPKWQPKETSTNGK